MGYVLEVDEKYVKVYWYDKYGNKVGKDIKKENIKMYIKWSWFNNLIVKVNIKTIFLLFF